MVQRAGFAYRAGIMSTRILLGSRTAKLVLAAFFLLFCGLSVYACDDDEAVVPDEVYVRAKKGVDFSDYKTFRIDDEVTEEDLADAGVDPDDIPKDLKLNIDTANDQARMELKKLGLTEIKEDEGGDLVVASIGSTKDEDAFYWECVPGYWWGYWGYYWDSCAWLDPVYVEWSVGSVAVGVADPEMKDVVFGGLLQGVVDGSGDAEERIRAGVHQMFEQWPED